MTWWRDGAPCHQRGVVHHYVVKKRLTGPDVCPGSHHRYDKYASTGLEATQCTISRTMPLSTKWLDTQQRDG
jgi:hypothetical protein